jgi:hypothetical protein
VTFDADDAKSALTWKFHKNALDSKDLNENIMFVKLKTRLLAFFVLQEKVRIEGKTQMIIKEEKSSGCSWEYRCEMHMCLKRLLNRVINTKDKVQQQDYLKETYFWFFKKLIAMGLLSYKE